MKNKLPAILLGCYFLLFITAGISPYDRSVWWAENIPIMLIVAVLIYLYPRFRFSNTAYILMAFLIYLHTIGGHFTFERVPFDAVNNFFGFERNNYDRFAHFSVGFYAFAIAELLLVKKLTSSRTLLILFPIFTIFTVAAVYEIFEWWFAVLADPSAGMAVLGSQGDIWDAQKDMLCDGSGSIIAMLIFIVKNRPAFFRPDSKIN